MAKVAKVYDGSAWQDIATNQPDNSNYPTYTSIQFGFRNELINGDFRINQRAYASGSALSTSDSATPLGYGYSFDRWKATTSGTFLNFASAPNGQQITISANGSIAQVIERQNITNGTHTLSWIGDAVGRVYNVGATAPAYAASPITVSLDGTANVIVEFTAVSTPRTLNLVQLEQGGRQTSFEYRPIGTELALCQRYYSRFSGLGMLNNHALTGVGIASSTTNVTIPGFFPVEMRVAPPLSGGLTYGGTLQLTDAVNYPTTGAVTLPTSNRFGYLINVACTGATQYRPYWLYANADVNAFIAFSAEL